VALDAARLEDRLDVAAKDDFARGRRRQRLNLLRCERCGVQGPEPESKAKQKGLLGMLH
jgi:hypothetical protein